MLRNKPELYVCEKHLSRSPFGTEVSRDDWRWRFSPDFPGVTQSEVKPWTVTLCFCHLSPLLPQIPLLINSTESVYTGSRTLGQVLVRNGGLFRRLYQQFVRTINPPPVWKRPTPQPHLKRFSLRYRHTSLYLPTNQCSSQSYLFLWWTTSRHNKFTECV